MTEAKALRAALREPRYAVQNVVKHNTKTLNDAKKIRPEKARGFNYGRYAFGGKNRREKKDIKL